MKARGITIRLAVALVAVLSSTDVRAVEETTEIHFDDRKIVLGRLGGS